MNIKFDFLGLAEMKRSLDDLHAKVDILLSEDNYVSPALEEEIREVMLKAKAIDKKVP